MTYDDMIQATRAALERRDIRRDVLAARIHELTTAALGAARQKLLDLGDAGQLEYRTCEAIVSEWADGSRARCAQEQHLILVLPGESRSLGRLDLSYFDGANWQNQRGAARDGTRQIRPATVVQLREVATALPDAITRLLAETQERAAGEVSEADTALGALPA